MMLIRWIDSTFTVQTHASRFLFTRTELADLALASVLGIYSHAPFSCTVEEKGGGLLADEPCILQSKQSRTNQDMVGLLSGPLPPSIAPALLRS
jgi:hypothetical protein